MYCKVHRNGNSKGITLPRGFVEARNIEIGDTVVIIDRTIRVMKKKKDVVK